MRLNGIKWGQIWPNWTKRGQIGKDLPNRAYQVKQGQTWPNGTKQGQTGPSRANWGDHPWVGVRAESILGLAGDPPRDGR